MKNFKKLLSGIIITTLLSAYLSFLPSVSLAVENNEKSQIDYFGDIKLSESFREYLENDDENALMPASFVVKDDSSQEALNPFYKSAQIGATNDKFSLKDLIPENMVIRNQKSTNSCWAFAGVGMTESSLALRNKNNGATTKTYDFSERHLVYSETDTYSDKKNPYAINREANAGGNYYNVINNMANGKGLVNEGDMPFVNSEAPIQSSQVEGKRVQTTLYDARYLPSYDASITATQRSSLMEEIKTFVRTYGGLYAGVYGDFSGGGHINLDEGSIYYSGDDKAADHAILIVGWDDNYSKSKFNNTPPADGAWIIKNSWGENRDMSYEDAVIMLKAEVLGSGAYPDKKYIEDVSNSELEAYFKAYIANHQPEMAETISSYTCEQIIMGLMQGDGYTYDQATNTFVSGQSVGDNGFMYVSYYDSTIYSTLVGFEKVTDTVDYNYAYSYDETGVLYEIGLSSGTFYYGNKYKRSDLSKDEFIKQVSITVSENCTVSVLVNTGGSDLKPSSLQSVSLKEGNSKTLTPGYHVLELASPVKITGNQFGVVLKVETGQANSGLLIEPIVTEDYLPDLYPLIKDNNIQSGVTYVSVMDQYFNNNEWVDLADLMGEGLPYKGNSTLRVYTTTNDPVTLSSIAVTKQPNKTSYTAGENFNKEGMEVTATYSDGSTAVVYDYTISGGNNLQVGTSSVTITYQGKTTTQAITVTAGTPSPSSTTSPSSSGNPSASPSTSSTTAPSTSTATTTSPSTTTEPSTNASSSASPSASSTTVPSTSIAPTTSPSSSIKPSTSTSSSASPSTSASASSSAAPSTSVAPSNSVKPSSSSNPSSSPTPTEGQPIPCDFSRATVRTTDIDSADKGTISVIVENLGISELNDSYEYYFYLSTNPNETNINKWIKIKGTPTDNKLAFTISKDEVSNYSDLLVNQNVYIYIEEITTKDGNQAVAMSKALKLKAYVETEPTDPDNPNPSVKPNSDPTVAKEPIPYTGAIKFITLIAIFAGCGIYFFKKYKKLDDDIKGK